MAEKHEIYGHTAIQHKIQLNASLLQCYKYITEEKYLLKTIKTIKIHKRQS